MVKLPGADFLGPFTDPRNDPANILNKFSETPPKPSGSTVALLVLGAIGLVACGLLALWGLGGVAETVATKAP